jgi:ATP-dependent Clp protease ATP-binding subunit ClpC
MAEDILHDEITEGDTVLITHDGESEELSFEVEEGEAPTEETPADANGEANSVSAEEVAEGASTDENGSGEEPSTASDEE